MIELHESEVFSAIGSISGSPKEEGYVHRFDTIEYQGGVWIVPSWLEALDETHKKPERIVCLHPMMLQEAQSNDDPTVRYTIVGPIPMSVLNGTGPSQSDYTVIEQPNIQVVSGSQ